MISSHIQCVSQPQLRKFKSLLGDMENLAAPSRKLKLNRMAEDGCLLIADATAVTSGSIGGAIGLDLESASIKLLTLKKKSTLPILLKAVEQLAVSFGMWKLELSGHPSAIRNLQLPGYIAGKDSGGITTLERSLSRRQTRLARKARKMNDALGLPREYGRTHRLSLQAEPSQLASIGLDVFKREQFMLPKAAKAFLSMQRMAAVDNICIQAVSAFRSMEYQAGLVERKLAKGLGVEQILSVSAAPGYSEHHSGQAIDITCPDFDPLEEEFADSPAFSWLSQHADNHGFYMSYPQGNRHGVAYEPWHWCFVSEPRLRTR